MWWQSIACCALWLALCAAGDFGNLWTPLTPVETVNVRIHWVSIAELRTAARNAGETPRTKPLGFSVLRKHPETGAYSCDIYMPKRPARLKDTATGSLGHELAHCLGFVHE